MSAIPAQALGRLNDNEKAVILLVIDGLSTKVIAHQLNMPFQTVNYHVANVVEKLDARNRTHAAILADREWRI